MPAISKIRLANIQYENGNKRINDELFIADGNNTAITLENGGGKTVFIQLLLQAILPKHTHAGRKIIETLELSNNPAHVAVEWIINENPRKYLVTSVSLFLKNNQLNSHIFLSEYDYDDVNNIEKIPFSIETNDKNMRVASHGEIRDYYLKRKHEDIHSHTFDTLKEYHNFLEKNYGISSKEWYSISKINSTEGGIEKFFENCSTTDSLVNNLLIPTIEDALEGENADLFTETFENHRKHLKEYKILKTTIEENKKIRDYLDEYVSVYKKYYLENLNYEALKSKFNSYYIYIEREKEKTDSILNELDVSLDTINKGLHNNKQLFSSLKIAQENLEYNILEKEKNELYSKLKVYESELEENKIKFNKLKLAGNLNEKRTLEEEIEGFKRQLKNIDCDESLEALVKEKNDLLSKLSYIYKEEVDKFNESINNIKKEIEDLNLKISSNEKLVNDKNKVIGLKNTEKNQLIGENNTLIGQINNDLNKLSGIDSIDEVESIKNKFLTDITNETNKKNNNVLLVNELKQENENLKIKKKELMNRFSANEQLLNVKETNIKQIETLSDSLKKQYFELFDNDLMDGVLYNSQNMILRDIKNRLQIINDSKEKALIKESNYLYENQKYKNQDVYFIESNIVNLLSDLRQKFKYVELGSEYIKKPDNDDNFDMLVKNYKFWPSTLICFEDYKYKLEEYLLKYKDSFEYPIFVISHIDIKNILDDNFRDESLLSLVPAIWTKNLFEDRYLAWKKKNSNILMEAKELRIFEENKIKAYQVLQSKIEDFFADYPKEYFDSLTNEIYNLKKSKDQYESSIVEVEHKIEENKSKINNLEDDIKYISELLSHLHRQVEYVINIIKYKSSLNNNNKVILSLDEKIDLLTKENADLDTLINADNYILKDLESSMHNLDKSLAVLVKEEYFIETVKLDIIETKNTKDVIITKLSTIKKIINEKSANRELIDENLKKTSHLLGKVEEKIMKLMEKLNYSVEDISMMDESILFISEEEQELKVEKSERLLKNITSDYSFAKEKSDKKESKINTLIDKHKEIYFIVDIFTTSLLAKKEELETEKSKLLNKLNDVEENQKKNIDIKNEIYNMIRILDINNAKYDFLNELYEYTSVEEAFEIDYKYNPLASINKKIELLKESHIQIEELILKKDDKKEEFIKFSRDNITEIRQRKSIISILSNREDYEEILEWQKNLSIKIDQVIKYAELDLREHDAEITKLIERLYIYVKKVTEELKLIESKTRVKIKENSKKIFNIIIPNFTESASIEIIRDHLLWMSKQLQKNDYSEDGIENIHLIKNDIKNWLSTTNLLSKVFNGQKIKVKCRKVTNDYMISSSPVEWTYSNKWSGGEKWSKNMTLYLGIQNYLVEKRHIDYVRNKVNRVVLLDNPFGAASSSHVLEPVFIISEQLGYQLITVTAHSEGKFLSDYFPIVYSCKLRPSKNNKAQIMSKEKEINYAFLKDHSPTSIIRLDEEEKRQLDLFELI